MSASELLDRTPPHSLDAERSVLGSVLLQPELLSQIALEPTDFHADAHQHVWRAYQHTLEAGCALDETTLIEALRQLGTFERIGGRPYVFELVDCVATPATALDLAKTVHHFASLRRVIRACTQVLQDAYAAGRPDVIIQRTEDTLAAALDSVSRDTGRKRNTTLEAACNAHLARHEMTRQRGSQPTHSTGLADLDRALGGGLEMGEFVVIGGRPSQGKTAIGLQILDNLAEQGLKTAFISEEMTPEKIGARTLKRLTSMPEADWADHAAEVRKALASHFTGRTPTVVTNSLGRTSLVVAEIERLYRTQGLDAVCIDYVQLLKGRGQGEFEQITDSIRELKTLTTRLDIITLALGQLNRESSKRPDPTPRLTDLKGSGEWEQAADVAILLHWPWMENNDHEPRGEYRMRLAKNRNRGIRVPVVGFTFDGERQTVREIPKARPMDFGSYDPEKGW